MRDLIALVPMGSVALLFWFVMRAMLGADRRERAALAALDAREVLHPTRTARVFDDSVVAGVVVGDIRDVRDVRDVPDAAAISAQPLTGPSGAQRPTPAA